MATHQSEPGVMADFETRSRVDLKQAGAWRYAEDDSTEILCMGYQLPGQEVRVWVPPAPFPQEVLDAIEAGMVFEAHNVQFERAVWINKLVPLGIPLPKRWRDTLAVCAYRSLPLKLDEAGRVLDLPIQKDARGSYLIQTLCRPRKPSKRDKREWAARWDLMEELYEYCERDVAAERILGEAIGELPTPELRLWVLDQTINQRGMAVDMEAVQAAQTVADIVQEDLTRELVAVTGGAVTGHGEVARIVAWLGGRGVHVPNLQRNTVEVTLRDADLPDDARRVLELRLALARSSTSKLVRFEAMTCADGRARGLLQYHGAGTGRWSGRLVQPQNFPRGMVEDPGRRGFDMERLVDAIKLGGQEAVNALTLVYGDPMAALASSLRGMFVAGPGRVLRVADFSAIEARVTMWLADQRDALDAFAAYDRGEGPDIYCVMAEKLYGRPINKHDDPEERQLGKITILGCGYQMSAPRLRAQAEENYGVVLDDDTAKFLVDGYRQSYYLVKNMWYDVQEVAQTALETSHRGQVFNYRNRIAFQYVEDAAGPWLNCVLPNGRRLWYYKPRVRSVHKSWGWTDQITYEGRDNKRGGRWGLVDTYGGMLVENVVQAISRDLMAEAMIRTEVAGYPTVLTVHDEIVTEVPGGHGSQEEFEELMAAPVPRWAAGCPVAVEGWCGTRYRK